MESSGLTLFRQMEQKMHWLSARQTVLSENVANADTPHFQPRDLKPFSLHGDGTIALEQTNPMHLTGSNGANGLSAKKDGVVIETSPDGNAVSLEDQLTKVADTGMDYQMMTNLYRKQLGMLKTALGRGASA